MSVSRNLIEKANALLSEESGTVFKEPGGRLNVCLVYPNTYRVGMSNLGYQGLYRLLNERDDVVCERAFLPDPEDMREYERTGSEVFALESKRPLARFDVVAFSLSFENDYPNVASILVLSRIPLASEERGEGHPLLMAGGVCAFFNPEPVAPIFDVMFVGEADDAVDEIVDAIKTSPDRRSAFENLLSVDGVYVPSYYDVLYGNDGTISARTNRAPSTAIIKKRIARDISLSRVKHTITTPNAEFSDMRLVEAMRGCPWNCRFCLAGHIYNPPRKKELSSLRAEIAYASSGKNRVGLVGPSLTDYPYIKDALEIPGVSFSITSLRASPKSAELAAIAGKKSVSIAPEAGTNRLRRVVNKRITAEDIIGTSKAVLDSGVERLRLYFMVGLPTETEEDVEGIVSLVNEIRSTSGKGSIVLTVSTFVPKPFTPFQWHPMEEMREIKDRLKIIKKGLVGAKGVAVFHDVPKYAYMQGLFSLGDRRVFGTLREMAEGADWMAACKKAGVDSGFYISRRKGFDETLPWDFIDAGVDRKRLWEEYMESLGDE